MHVTVDVARRIERAEIEFCALAGSDSGGRRVEMIEAGGARALFSQPRSPLNKALGLGLQGPVEDDDLRTIEGFYRSRNSPTQIELCPLAYADVAARLCARGFVVEAFENELGMALVGDFSGSRISDVRVTRTTPDQDDRWVRIVAEGFAAAEPPAGGGPDAPPLTLDLMVEMMSQFAHPDIRRYLAWIDDEPAGGGAAWIYDGVLGIFGTATRPAFRRRGIQTAVTIQAIKDARGEADLVIATTAPGSTSQRTFERLGFHVLYTRTIFVKA